MEKLIDVLYFYAIFKAVDFIFSVLVNYWTKIKTRLAARQWRRENQQYAVYGGDGKTIIGWDIPSSVSRARSLARHRGGL